MMLPVCSLGVKEAFMGKKIGFHENRKHVLKKHFIFLRERPLTTNHIGVTIRLIKVQQTGAKSDFKPTTVERSYLLLLFLAQVDEGNP